MVPDVVDYSGVAFQRREKYAVGWRSQKRPKWESRKPDTTNELVVGAVTWHTSAVHLDNSRQQRDERRTHVYDALVQD